MIDFVRVEHIRAQRLLALCQCELLCWKEGQQKSFSSAVRAIATDRLGRQLSVNFELNSSAVTASFKHWGSLYTNLQVHGIRAGSMKHCLPRSSYVTPSHR